MNHFTNCFAPSHLCVPCHWNIINRHNYDGGGAWGLLPLGYNDPWVILGRARKSLAILRNSKEEKTGTIRTREWPQASLLR